MRSSFLVVLVCLVACGSDSTSSGGADGSAPSRTSDGGALSGPPPISGATDSTPVNRIALEEKKAVCDWVAMQWGGYGVVVECGANKTISGPESQDACLAKSFPNCTASWGELKACVAAIAKARCDIYKGSLPAECTRLPAGCIGS